MSNQLTAFPGVESEQQICRDDERRDAPSIGMGWLAETG